MNTMKSIARRMTLGIAAFVCCLAFSGCEYDVPITSKPTRKIEQGLLGDWISKDGKSKMKVRKLDDFTYVVDFNGQLSRAYHSDVAKTPFVSVQDIDSEKRQYAYLTWKLSEEATELRLRAVNSEVIPFQTKDSADVQKLLKKNLQNPKLFDEEMLFTREK